MNVITVGTTDFDDTKILSCNIYKVSSMAMDELELDTMEADLLCNDPSILKIHEVVTIKIENGSSKLASYRLNRVDRVSANVYKIYCTSPLGTLEDSMFYGGLYSGYKAYDLITDILGFGNFTMDAVLAETPIHGWLPIGTKRDSLRQVLFAIGGAFYYPNGGVKPEITVPGSYENVILNSTSKVLDEISVEETSPSDRVIVVEHSYYSSEKIERERLFEGTPVVSNFTSPKGASVRGMLIPFDKPFYWYYWYGLSTIELGVNYVILAEGGYGTLDGIPYGHTIREVYTGAQESDREIRVDDATLINELNSDAIASRLLNYYSKPEKAKATVIVDRSNPIRPADKTQLPKIYGSGAMIGRVLNADFNISNTIFADIEVLLNFERVPDQSYNTYEILTGTGTFTVPKGVTKIHAVLIGGGYGGNGGGGGGEGQTFTLDVSGDYGASGHTQGIAKGGDGGFGGDGGSGGLVYQVTLAVTEGQNFSYSALPGAGGDGGEGYDGTNLEAYYGKPPSSSTVFGSYSSSDGSYMEGGYRNLITGIIYARPGKAGETGGKGGDGGGKSGSAYLNGEKGEDVAEAIGGTGGEPESGVYDSDIQFFSWERAGHGGGGSAFGANGGVPTGGNDGTTGAGANAAPKAAASQYGDGGDGGGGGGGGGGAGAAEIEVRGGNGKAHYYPDSGSRGKGGKGGKGGDGCVIIYYHRS